MKKHHPILFLAAGLYAMLSSSAQAAIAVDLGSLAMNGYTSYTGEIDTANQIDNYTFTISSPETVELYTSSASPFNPFLTLWKVNSDGTDATLLTSNDDRATANFFETNNGKDAQIFSNLVAGTYEISVTESGNFAAGTLLSAGFTNGGQQSANFYSYDINLQASAAVPLPTTVWMFGSALMGLLGVSRKKRFI
ncbi:DVUA0089 family protein [Methylomonas sp. AM2-LC]|uniref:DVUA0089 family protein n=1 Tax=Methylomonas sp. AM2-LC TaxID=3153301 RepID=UPI003262D9EF